MKKLTNDIFIEKAIKIHNNKYDYSLVNYVSSRKNVKIICKVHGVFEQRVSNHLNGSGCKKCIDNYNSIGKKLFIERSTKIHNNKYDYSIVNYINNKTKVKIVCPEHGVFEQNVADHLSGSACPSCNKLGGFDPSKESSFYIQKLFNEHNEFIAIKIGITNKKASYRMKQQSYKSIYRHELFTDIRDKGFIIQKLERLVKKRFCNFKADIDKNNMKDGFTETFNSSSLFMIHSYIMSEYEVLYNEFKAVN